MPCTFCKTAERIQSGKESTCPNCGTPTSCVTFTDIIYGKKMKDRIRVEIAISEKYIIVHRVPGQKGASAAFGLLGTIAASVADKRETFGFYDRDEIKEVIFPYRNKRLKDDLALKIVNKDGTDFIIYGPMGSSQAHTAGLLRNGGYPMVDGSNTNYGDRFCDKPFVDADSVGCRLCASAARFVKQGKGNYAAAPIVDPMPYYQPPVQPPVQPQYVPQPQPVQSAPVVCTPQPAPMSAPRPAAAGEEFKFCHECGNKLLISDKFCVKCGSRQR